MATDRSPRPIHYPETDGKPMGETEIHVLELMRLYQILMDYLAARDDAYVFADMMFYYVEGNPREVVSPDVCVVFGVPKRPLRRVFKLWEEASPAAVFEITSRSSRRDDFVKKRAVYARIGVAEYYLYDPLAEYLRPPFQGYRLEDGEYRAIEPAADGALASEALALRLVLVNSRLELFDQTTGKRLLSREERIAELERLLREREPEQ